MELWMTEYQTRALGLSFKVTETLRLEKTPFQELAVIVTEQHGRMLLLDGMVQTTEEDEFVYHEMITLPALYAHPHPKKVLIIGGGDGGTLREVVNHPLVEQGILVEIDARVLQASRDFFPQLCQAFNHVKAQVCVDDGIRYVKERQDEFDIIMVDSTEPVGPAVALFSAEFYRDAFRALKGDGMLVVQSESPFYNKDVIQKAFGGISKLFPITKLYQASIPTYPSGLWTFTVGSKKYDPAQVMTLPAQSHKYYNPALHEGAFKLPQFVKELIRGIAKA